MGKILSVLCGQSRLCLTLLKIANISLTQAVASCFDIGGVEHVCSIKIKAVAEGERTVEAVWIAGAHFHGFWTHASGIPASLDAQPFVVASYKRLVIPCNVHLATLQVCLHLLCIRILGRVCQWLQAARRAQVWLYEPVHRRSTNKTLSAFNLAKGCCGRICNLHRLLVMVGRVQHYF